MIWRILGVMFGAVLITGLIISGLSYLPAGIAAALGILMGMFTGISIGRYTTEKP